MGLDLGTRTIGLALSDTTLTIASPVTTLKRIRLAPDLAALAEIVRERKVGAFILGLPLNMDGSEGPRAQATRAFVRNVAKNGVFPEMPVILWDERLSTIAVTRTLIDADTSRAKRAEVVDKLAATYILQGYLDFLNGGAG